MPKEAFEGLAGLKVLPAPFLFPKKGVMKMMDMIGKLLGLSVNSPAPVNPVRANPKKPRKKLMFSSTRKHMYAVIQFLNGSSTIYDYRKASTTTEKVRLTKGVLRMILALLTLFYRAPKKKK